MAKSILTNAGIYFGGYELSGYANSVLLEGSADLLDVTTFGNLSREYKVGAKGARFSAAGIYDPVNVDAVLNDKWGDPDEIISLLATNAVGGIAYFMRGCEGEYAVEGSMNQPATWSMSGITTQSPIARGVCLHRAAAAAVTGAGSGQELGAIGGSATGYAALHVFGIAGTSTPTLTVKIQSDADGDFGTGANDRITFTAATAIGAQWASVAGPVTDTHWRVSYTISGTNPSFGFAVMFSTS